MAFGTGTHPTTRLSIEALEAVMRGGEKVIDVGTGSGVLSIAAKAMGADTVYAYDIDEIATRVSKENIAYNAYASDVIVKENNLLVGNCRSASGHHCCEYPGGNSSAVASRCLQEPQG